jgi:hypothetical protein
VHNNEGVLTPEELKAHDHFNELYDGLCETHPEIARQVDALHHDFALKCEERRQ